MTRTEEIIAQICSDVLDVGCGIISQYYSVENRTITTNDSKLTLYFTFVLNILNFSMQISQKLGSKG